VPSVSVAGTTVWSDETEVPVSGDGSGMTSPDAQVSPRVQLRSERRGTGDGRVYLLISKPTEGTGHSCCTVTVPHSQSASSIASAASQAQAAQAYCTTTGRAPTNYFQHGVSSAVSGSGNEAAAKASTAKLKKKVKKAKARSKR
jgi:hypothetical protein